MKEVSARGGACSATQDQVPQVMTAFNEQRKAHSQSGTTQSKGSDGFRVATAPISPPPLTRPRKFPEYGFPADALDIWREVPANLRTAVNEGPSQRTQANVSGSTAQSHVSACRACGKKITRSFDPIVRCHVCSRAYHESCSRSMAAPSLCDDQFQCYKCIPRQHKSQMPASKTSFARHDVAQPGRDNPLKLISSSVEGTRMPRYRTEVPDTPQHLNPGEDRTLPNPLADVQRKSITLSDACDSSLLSVEHLDSADRTMHQALCCVCNKIPVQKGEGRKGVKCSQCSVAAKDLASYKTNLTIPETPQTLLPPIPSIETDIQVHSPSLPMTITPSEPRSASSTDQVLGDETPDTDDTNTTVRVSLECSSFTDSETRLSPISNTLNTISKHSALGEGEPYTLKDFVAAALLAAKGKPCTRIQISNWLRENRPAYCLEDGNLDRSIRKQLLLSEDFVASGTEGLSDQLWTFTNEQCRSKYMKLYEQRPTLMASWQQSPIEEPASQRSASIHATDTSDSSPSEESRLIGSEAQVSEMPDVQNSGRPYEFQELIFSDVRRETDFFRAFPQYTRPRIEMMSEEDVRKKIAEIKKRPSRKAGFSDYIRAGSRRVLQRDPHDELCDQGFSSLYLDLRGNAAEDVEKQDVEQQMSLKDVFNLPDDPIPIVHEGQLAFRDGKTVNGRLPRSRAVYKVGRVLGSGLQL